MENILATIQSHYETSKHSLMQRTYIFAGYRFDIEDREGVQWEIIEGYLPEIPTGSAAEDYRIIHVRCSQLYGKIKKAVEVNVLEHSDIETFKHGIFHRKYYKLGNERKQGIFLPLYDDEYIIVKNADNHFIIVTTDKTRDRNTHVLRVIREIVYRRSENEGFLMLHGAAVSMNHKGVIICGEKGAGKTTLLMNLLLCGYSYIANDRVLIDPDKHRVNIRTIPHLVRLGRGTIDNLQSVKAKIEQLSFSRPQFFNYKDIEMDFCSNKKVEIVPRELMYITDAAQSHSANIYCILFPKFDFKAESITLERLDPADTESLLNQQCLTPVDESWLNPWLVERDCSNEVLLEKTKEKIKKIAEKAHSFRLTFGKNFLKEFNPTFLME